MSQSWSHSVTASSAVFLSQGQASGSRLYTGPAQARRPAGAAVTHSTVVVGPESFMFIQLLLLQYFNPSLIVISLMVSVAVMHHVY